MRFAAVRFVLVRFEPVRSATRRFWPARFLPEKSHFARYAPGPGLHLDVYAPADDAGPSMTATLNAMAARLAAVHRPLIGRAVGVTTAP
jgi:hypothetical protein